MRTCGRPLFWRQLAKAFKQRGDLALLAQVVNAQLLQRLAVFGGGNLFPGLCGQWFEVFHRSSLDNRYLRGEC